jgi:hypothetical protein
VRKDGTRRNKQVPVLLRGDLREKGTERARGRQGGRGEREGRRRKIIRREGARARELHGVRGIEEMDG